MKKIKNLMVSVVAMVVMAVYGLFGLAGEVFAVQSKVALSPMSSRIILKPGEVYNGSIQIMNPADMKEDLKYVIEIGSYSVKPSKESKDSYGDLDVKTKGDMNVMTNWITLENERGTLAPNEIKTISYTINVPKDAPAGGQYATLLVHEDVGESVVEGATINEVVQMASILYAEVAGSTREEGKITENNIPSFLLDDTFEATAMVENNGNVHTDATFELKVSPMGSSDDVCATKEEDSKTIVLPNTKKYHQESCKLPGPGIYTAKQTIKIFGEISEKESTIIYCPIWLMLVVVFGIALVIGWIVMLMKKRKK